MAPLITYIMTIDGLDLVFNKLPDVDWLNSISVQALSTSLTNLRLEFLPNNQILLFNFLWLIGDRYANANSEDLISYASCILTLLNSFPHSLISSYNVQIEDADSDIEGAAIVVEHDTYLEKCEERLVSNHHIVQLCRALENVKAYHIMALYFTKLMSVFSCKRDDILTFVLLQRSTPLLQGLWALIEENQMLASAETVTFEESASHLWSTLVFFAKLYRRTLLTMGDDEFFGPSAPLSLDHMKFISSRINLIVFRMFWNPESFADRLAGSNLSIQYIREELTNFIRQIHRRDSRRQFCPANHWLIEGDPGLTRCMLLVPTADDTHPARGRVERCQSILHSIPFVIPFNLRVSLFRAFVNHDRGGNDINTWMKPVTRVTIRRGRVFEDGYASINALGPRLKGKVAITFVDKFGLEEAGIDGGGVFKEFLTSCLHEAFSPNFGLFQTTKDQSLYPATTEYAAQEEQLNYFQFLGRVIGKALSEGVLIDSSFAGFFLRKWLGASSYVDDLPSLDQDLYQGLLFLKSYNGDVEKDLSLSFSMTEQAFGVTRNIDLIRNGSQVPVTNENRIRYIYLVANYKLNVQISKQCAKFFNGLVDLIDPSWLKMFNQNELQILLGGNAAPIDMGDLKEHTVYGGVYDENHPTIQIFWQVVEDFDETDKQKLIKFITSCSRPPLLGFSELRPQLSIRFAGQEQDRLPSASTCVNLLKLPSYNSYNVLKEYYIDNIES